METFRFEPCKAGELSAFGVGKATFVANSPPFRRDFLQLSLMKAGEVTAAIDIMAYEENVLATLVSGKHKQMFEITGRASRRQRL